MIVGDVLIASAFVSYAGPFNKGFRTIMIDQTFMKYCKDNGIATTPGKDPVKMLTPDSTAAEWN